MVYIFTQVLSCSKLNYNMWNNFHFRMLAKLLWMVGHNNRLWHDSKPSMDFLQRSFILRLYFTQANWFPGFHQIPIDRAARSHPGAKSPNRSLWSSCQRDNTCTELRAQQPEEDCAIYRAPAPGHHNIECPPPCEVDRRCWAVPYGARPSVHAGAARPLPCPAAVIERMGAVNMFADIDQIKREKKKVGLYFCTWQIWLPG
jgi:hypothetical protein